MNPLIVPINVRALCVNDPQATFVGASADFSTFPAYTASGTLEGATDYLASNIGSYPMVTSDIGVRLHWTLPAALRHGVQDPATGKTSFPRVPNRWLITRILTTDDDATPRLKSWVLESDRLEKRGPASAPYSATMPFQDTPPEGQFFRYLGFWHDYDEWAEDPSRNSFEKLTGHPLTAVGYGDHLFASYAPNCPNVFSFTDGFEQTLVPPAPAGQGNAPGGVALDKAYELTYVVTGWYAGAVGDPIRESPSPLNGNDNAFDWGFDGDIPDRVIASGTIFNLHWKPLGTPGQPTLPPVPEIAVGATAAEALSALAASDVALQALGDAEFALDAIQAGLFNRLNGHPGWIAALEADLHRRSYTAHHGGHAWKVLDARTPDIKAVDAAKDQAEAPLLPTSASALAELNAKQQAYDTARFSIDARSRQMFLDWYRRQLLAGIRETDPPLAWQAVVPNLNSGDVENIIQAELELLAQQQSDTGQLLITAANGNDVVKTADANDTASLAASVTAAWTALSASLPAHLRIKRTPAPRFWAPSDPVILLRGPAVAPPFRAGAPGDFTDDGRLLCRLGVNILSNFPLNAEPRADFLNPSFAPGFGFSRLEAGVSDVAAALAAEAILLDKRFETSLQKLVGATTSLWGAAQTIGTGPTPSEGDAEHPVSGVLPPPLARTDGSVDDWSPLLLRWSILYRNYADTGIDGQTKDIEPTVLTAKHQFDPDRIELEMPSSAPIPLDRDWFEYSGWAPLSSKATVNLASALATASTGRTDDPELEQLAAHLSQAPIMAQAAGGFHEALLMREQTMQLKVVDLLNPSFPLAQNIAKALGRLAVAAPEANKPYAGLRSGYVALNDLQVVDIFGRVVAFDGSKAVWARSFKTSDNRTVLPPRLSQPSRLQFRWLAAGTMDVEAGDHPAATPVCGWVVPNYLDGSLDLYAADGHALGALRAGVDGTARWHPAPQKTGPVEGAAGDPDAQTKAISLDIQDLDLRAFATAVVQQPGYLSSLLHMIDRALCTVVPPDPGAATAFLMGRPLALARAAVSLELKGGAAVDQGWQALQADATASADDNWTGQRQDRGLAHVAVPVRIGDTKSAADGLVGYFLPKTSGYSTFYSPADNAEGHGVVAATPLSIASTDAPVMTAVLMDPRAAVHATSGVLPVKAITIPPGAFEPALGRMEVSFYAGPMLFPSGRRPTPLPHLPGFEWKWQSATAGQWGEVDVDPPLTDSAFHGFDVQRLEEGWVALRNTAPVASDKG